MAQSIGSRLARLRFVLGDEEPLQVAGTPGNDNLTGDGTAETISGGDGNDIIRGLGGADSLNGGALSDQLYGGDQNDILNGGAGGDILYGEADDDTLYGVDGADKLFGGDGIDTLDGGTGADRMDGGAGADILYGRADNDLLDGGAGIDLMTGGLGNDIYVIDEFGDQTVEGFGQGYDIVRTSINEVRLQANIEGLELQGVGNISGYGNDLANNLQGNAGRNSLFGAGGVDTINGGDGDDFIAGGLGGDHLRGGAGADRFAFYNVLLSYAFETDIIYDFNAAEGDILDFSSAGRSFRLLVDLVGDRTLVRFAAPQGPGYYGQVWINGDVTAAVADWIL